MLKVEFHWKNIPFFFFLIRTSMGEASGFWVEGSQQSASSFVTMVMMN